MIIPFPGRTGTSGLKQRPKPSYQYGLCAENMEGAIAAFAEFCDHEDECTYVVSEHTDNLEDSGRLVLDTERLTAQFERGTATVFSFGNLTDQKFIEAVFESNGANTEDEALAAWSRGRAATRVKFTGFVNAPRFGDRVTIGACADDGTTRWVVVSRNLRD